MNAPLRRVAVACLVLFGLLLANANFVQLVQADDLRDNPRNSRVLIEEYASPRGAIVVGGEAVAESTPTDDALEYLRSYPGGPVYGHVTGFYSLVYGSTAIERTENGVLSGDDPRLFVRRLSDLVTGRSSEGANVVLTLSKAAQEAAYDALGNRRGAVVALDPRTGAILALVSRPSYDPNPLSSHQPAEIRRVYEQLTADPAEPLLNRATRQTYPPGSVFKIVTAAAALSAGATPETVVPAPAELILPQTDRPLRNFGGAACDPSGEQPLADAFRISCNTAFAQLGLDLGSDALRQQAEAFGFGEDLEIPLPVEPSVFPADLTPPQVGQSAIGQFDVRMTAVQGALLAAGVANDGVVMRPQLVRQVVAPDLSVFSEPEPDQLSRAISPEVAGQLAAMMEAVVADGTATAAQLPGVRVAGKTGTAQRGQGQPPHAWFAGFAPVDDPVVAVAVIVEDGGDLGSEATGGRVAAPVGRAVMAAVLDEVSGS